MGIKAITKTVIQKACRGLRGVKSNKVVFCSFNGKTYSDNPKAISEKLKAIAPDTEIVWLFSNPEAKKAIVPDYVQCVDINSKFSFWKEVCTCKVFVTNFLLPVVNKHKKQYFIQTWHGDKAFKKVLLDSTHSFVPEQVKGYCNLAIAGSDYGEKQYRSAFGYAGEVLKVGTPRNDRYLSPSVAEINEIKKSIGISENVGVLLYAPTLRDKARDACVAQDIQEIDIDATLKALREKYQRDWVCLVRAHPGVVALAGVKNSDDILDVSNYEDMSDLLLASDILITDYSSTAGDFVLLNRPVILFHSDIEDYCKNTRALYFDINDSPYFTVKNQNELNRLVAQLTDEQVRENCKAVLEFYGDCETGKAAEKVAQIIVERIKR